MKKENKILTYEQAKELKFFCQSVVGTRQEYYKVLGEVDLFKHKLNRLEKTCELIEKYLGEELKGIHSVFHEGDR